MLTLKNEITLEEVIRDETFIDNRTFEYLFIIEDIIKRIDEEDILKNDTEALWRAIDDELIYCSQQWTILKEWCTPTEADWNYASEQFTNDCLEVFDKVFSKWFDVCDENGLIEDEFDTDETETA